MAWLVLSVLALLATQGLGEIIEPNATPQRIADKVFLQKQIDLLKLYFHINEPIADPEVKTIAETWDLEKNIESYKNVTALKMFLSLSEFKMQVPKGVPFNIYDLAHQYHAMNLFNLLYSAKDYNTFYKTAVYLRERINEGMFVYVLSVAILNHPETQDIVIPPLYEIFPSYFHNAMIINIAQRINVHGKNLVDKYPQTYLQGDNVVIRWNTTVWPFSNNVDMPLSYFTNDYHLNALYYNFHLVYPFWLSTKSPLTKLNRGEYDWFFHKQFVTRYYLDRLSNGLGEIPELDLDLVIEGCDSGLVFNGIPLPVRPNYFSLKQPQFLGHIERIKELEGRIREAIDLGYLIGLNGEKISLRTGDALKILADVIEGNMDSPNLPYYGNLVTAWKELLGNSILPNHHYLEGTSRVKLGVPSLLELPQTSFRDPAFFMIWKRMLKFFNLYQKYLPSYEDEDLKLPGIKIEKVEVDKLVTYFENTYLNVTNELYRNDVERKTGIDQVSVLVQKPQLTHKKYSFRFTVNSNEAKKVVVRIFLAPKYDSKGYEIPLHENTFNFFQLDQFIYELPKGDSVIKRDSNGNMYMIEKWSTSQEILNKAQDALKGKGEFVLDMSEFYNGYPLRMNLPKGRVGGMPFLLFVHISDYVAPSKPFGTGLNPDETLGVGTGARRMTEYPLNYPMDRPLYHYQLINLPNVYLQDILIYHKETPEITIPLSQ